MQAVSDSYEILRTHTQKDNLLENEWKYYHFYSNGTGNEIKIYVNSSG